MRVISCPYDQALGLGAVAFITSLQGCVLPRGEKPAFITSRGEKRQDKKNAFAE